MTVSGLTISNTAPLFPKTRNDHPKQTVCRSETCALLLSLEHRQLITEAQEFRSADLPAAGNTTAA